ncbi:MAG: (d)CMP kinase [Actinomycetota bacterium]
MIPFTRLREQNGSRDEVMNVENMVIAIDGPAGSGKSSAAQRLARSLSLCYLDTGSMYRALTLKALNEHVDMDNEQGLSKMAQGLEIRIVYFPRKKPPYRIYMDGEDITKRIRARDVSAHVSRVSSHKDVRLEMIKKQRRMAERGGMVAEGRDAGTAVFPKADLKIFLTASMKERARRRYNEMNKEGHQVSLKLVQQEMVRRDHQDSTRTYSPLRKARDAVVVDTTYMSVSKVVKELVRLAKQRAEGGE